MGPAHMGVLGDEDHIVERRMAGLLADGKAGHAHHDLYRNLLNVNDKRSSEYRKVPGHAQVPKV